MKENRNWLGKASALALAASMWSVGHAQTTGQLDIFGSFNPGPWDTAAGGVEGSYGGPFVGTYTPTGLPAVSLSMFCLSIPEGFYYNTPFDVHASVETTQAGWLVDNEANLLGLNAANDSTLGLSDSALAESDALQLAIWSVTPASNGATPYDPAHSGIVTSGSVIGSLYPATSADYQNDMQLLGSNNLGIAYYFTIPNYTNNNGQPQIAPWTPNPFNPLNVPGAAPGPAAAIPFGLGLIARLRRRKSAKA